MLWLWPLFLQGNSPRAGNYFRYIKANKRTERIILDIPRPSNWVYLIRGAVKPIEWKEMVKRGHRSTVGHWRFHAHTFFLVALFSFLLANHTFRGLRFPWWMKFLYKHHQAKRWPRVTIWIICSVSKIWADRKKGRGWVSGNVCTCGLYVTVTGTIYSDNKVQIRPLWVANIKLTRSLFRSQCFFIFSDNQIRWILQRMTMCCNSANSLGENN